MLSKYLWDECFGYVLGCNMNHICPEWNSTGLEMFWLWFGREGASLFPVSQCTWFLSMVSTLFFFFFLAKLHSMFDLSSPTRDQTCAPCIGSWSLNHWTTKKAPWFLLLSILLIRTWDLLYFSSPIIWIM